MRSRCLIAPEEQKGGQLSFDLLSEEAIQPSFWAQDAVIGAHNMASLIPQLRARRIRARYAHCRAGPRCRGTTPMVPPDVTSARRMGTPCIADSV